MFEFVKRFVKRVIGLFSTTEIKNVFNIDIALTEEMQRHILLWTEMYCGNAPWLNEDVVSLRLEKMATAIPPASDGGLRLPKV